ncbi:MAG: hypothetical protein PHC62_00400 [Candidatus Izemoplasmatales bacterium]|nr:hypothetical protein [Candidatus Izemoplasmatales bacterium]
MAVFDHINSNFLDIFTEFDAGDGSTPDETDDELETIDDEGTDEPEDDDTPEEPDEEDQLDTIDDEEVASAEPIEEPDNDETDNQDGGETDDSEEFETIDDTSSDGEEDIGGDETGEENPEGSDDEELETIDGDNDGMESDEEDSNSDDGSGEEGESNFDGDSDSTEGEMSDPHQKLKELEAEIFDQLSEDEKIAKKVELKKLYTNLVVKSDDIFKLTQEISKTDETTKVIDYILNTLMDLKTYMSDYVLTMYDNRTYIQNNVNFQKFLAIFDSIHAIFQEIKNQDEKEEDNK